jgi:hypothetical protein
VRADDPIDAVAVLVFLKQPRRGAGGESIRLSIYLSGTVKVTHASSLALGSWK